MDAAYKLSKTSILFLSLTLMAIAPWRAQAQTFSTTADTVVLPSTGAVSRAIGGTEDNNSPSVPLHFSYAISYTAGDPTWLSINGGCSSSGAGGSTPVPMTFAVGCNTAGLSANTTHTATVTLTATAPGTGTETISVSYYSGGAGTQTLIPSTSAVPISATLGGVGYGSFSLSTNSAVPVSYSITPNVSWLTFTQNQSGTVYTGNPVTIGLQANAGTMVAGTYPANLQISYNGTTLNVAVNFTVGSGTSNGTLTFYPSNSFSFAYTSGGALPNSQSASISNSSASTYAFSVSASPNSWLAVNGLTSGTSGSYQIGYPITLALDSNATVLNTGSYTAIVTVTDSNNNTGTITVGLSVNSGSSGLTVSPNPITLNAAAGINTVQVNVSVTSTISGTLTASVTGSGLSITYGSSQTVSAGVPVTVVVQGNSSGLSGTYTGSLLLQVNTSSISQSYSVTFTVGGGGCTGCSGGSSALVAPTSLNFYYEIGQPPSAGQLSQQITIGGPSNFSLGTGQPVQNNGPTGLAWLNAAQPIQGSPGSLVTIGVSPTLSVGGVGPLTAGTYTGYYTVTFPSTGATQQVNVTLTVTNSAELVANPGVVNVNCNQCASPQPAEFIQVVATDGSSLPISVSSTSTGGWLTASVSSTGGTTPTSIQYQVTPGSLANGLYSGNIAVTSGALTLNIPVVLYIEGSSTSNGGNLTLSTSSLTFNAQVNGSSPGSQNLSVTSSSTTNFTASASVTTTSNGIQWLSITPSGNLNTNQTLVVSVAQTGLPIGIYSGSVQLASGGITQSVAVTLNVSSTGTGGTGNVTVTPSSLTNFSYQTGANVPSSQTLNVASASGSAGIGFTAAANSTGGNWLVVAPTSGTTPASLTVSLSASVLSALSAGTYTGNIVISPSGGTVVTLPVSLTVMSAPTVSATPPSLSFSYQSGGNTLSPGSISVSGSTNGLSFTATSAVSGSGSWLSISPTSGTTPASITVNVNPSGLAAGTYSGTVTVSGSGSATGSTTVNVTLTVTAPLPTITAVVNAASFMGGFQVSPGEIVSIGGTALGPTAGVGLMLDSSGKVSTSIGGVTVLFNGFAAPLIYVSATQINCVAPYEIAGSISPYVQVKYLGQTSNAWSLQPAVAAPAIFTANAGGTGPGAILNPDGSFNSQKAAPKGGEIAVYMTGEGQTAPAGVTGKVTTANLPPPQVTPAPLLPVSALIGGQPALVVYAGEAPGLVSGVMQVNVVIPATAPSGNLAITISVGTASSQQGVTVAVQ